MTGPNLSAWAINHPSLIRLSDRPVSILSKPLIRIIGPVDGIPANA
jgi:hypothetical protein